MRNISLAGLALVVAACGGAGVPQEQLTAAKAAVSGAEVGGAGAEPKAALHLKLAKEQITKAEALIADGEDEEAARVIERAQADAELALALSREHKARGEAQTTREQLERLKKSAQ